MNTENKDKDLRTRLLGVTALAAEYCITVENAAESETEDFVGAMVRLLPRLYLDFIDIDPEKFTNHQQSGLTDDDAPEDDDPDAFDPDALVALGEEDEAYYATYVDEDYYNAVRRHIGQLLGPDDVFLETFEEDMKYSDTPIAASVSECLADIFQPLYNFISIVRDSEGEHLEGAYRQCHEEFISYWSQTLCNVMRPLNNIHFKK